MVAVLFRMLPCIHTEAASTTRPCLQVVVVDEDPTDDDCVSAGAAFLARVLQYQETPQYLRK